MRSTYDRVLSALAVFVALALAVLAVGCGAVVEPCASARLVTDTSWAAAAPPATDSLPFVVSYPVCVAPGGM